MSFLLLVHLLLPVMYRVRCFNSDLAEFLKKWIYSKIDLFKSTFGNLLITCRHLFANGGEVMKSDKKLRKKKQKLFN